MVTLVLSTLRDCYWGKTTTEVHKPVQPQPRGAKWHHGAKALLQVMWRCGSGGELLPLYFNHKWTYVDTPTSYRLTAPDGGHWGASIEGVRCSGVWHQRPLMDLLYGSELHDYCAEPPQLYDIAMTLCIISRPM